MITAAHCITDQDSTNLLPANKFNIILGLQSLTTLFGDEILRKASRLIKHPDFERHPFFENDIGLIIIDAVQFSEYVLPICLRENFLLNPAGQKGTTVGFGEDENRYLNENLSAVDLEIVPRRTCIAKNLYYASQSELSTYCSGSLAANSAVCRGSKFNPKVL